MEIWIIWLIVAVVLVVLEIISQMIWTLCLAIGCLGALVADLCGASIVGQIITLALTAIVAFVALMPLFKRWHDTAANPRHESVATGMDALLGRRARLLGDIEPGGMGRVRIDGDNWQVKAPGDHPVITQGTEVVVTGYDGNILEVKTDKSPFPTIC